MYCMQKAKFNFLITECQFSSVFFLLVPDKIPAVLSTSNLDVILKCIVLVELLYHCANGKFKCYDILFEVFWG